MIADNLTAHFSPSCAARLGVIKHVIVNNYNLITIFKIIECNCNWTLLNYINCNFINYSEKKESNWQLLFNYFYLHLHQI